ncbi:hypothetical protein EPUS_05633 [Endocarpon pusillum Z07020]|uniref:Heterokaryon incompatibility domain-containing protein n=1 Tax=Endocarpon pusillum (strain Z07020 / HMAS-L-300199) TaxID=1263415 RepID=U1HHZ5_ENDPU|nr:uncharacterized protein EPUS_05633 [Endocarpon pusillum Z07020]ERF68494.1 hypothetical protein EPUS_05633 [Endocarpon pusillum Z07020]
MKTEAEVNVIDATSQVDVSKHFDGQKHWSWAKWGQYRNPDRVAEQATTSEHFVHRDILSRVTTRPKDVLRYLSPTYGRPIRMRVQSVDVHQGGGDWRRVEVQGNAPWLLRLSSWIIKTSGSTMDITDILLIAGKVLLVLPAHIFILLIPMGNESAVRSTYYSLLIRCWDYPRYARNTLDASPLAADTVDWKNNLYVVNGDMSRLLRPRRLIVRRGASWELVTNSAEPYLFVSYTATQFSPKDPSACQRLERLAEKMTEEAGLTAYWLDHRCMEQTPGPLFSEDVYRICDCIRGAVGVCVMVPDFSEASMANWGNRLWTLPEALLSSSLNIKFCSADSTMEISKIALASDVWKDGQVSRLLAEHFSGLLTLSRLELISLGLEALGSRETQNLHTQGDLAYALMSLLKQRPRTNPNDTLFQALARLSLANDSDQIVERMMCMLPDVGASPKLNKKFVVNDQLGAKLWDIQPLCQVAGVCGDEGVILDGCRGISIRWKDIPQITYLRRKAWKRMFAEIGLRSGPLWFIIGCIMVGMPSTVATGAILLVIGLVLLIAAPWSVQLLYGGKIWGQSPWLIGIEGVLPIAKIEHLAFGNAIGRISYAPSSTLLSCKQARERVGEGPGWIERPGSCAPPTLAPGQRFFTLLDTGSMTVSVFAAERPPSAALICGQEGGMLRVVLCHYERSTGTMHKETVLRMETPMLDQASLLGWVKIA